MSYCRFSTDDGTCDLFCFERDSGFVTYVAKTKVKEGMEKALYRASTQEVLNHPRKYSQDVLHNAAGKRFKDKTVAKMLKRVLRLREEGIKVPDSVIAHMRYDAEKETKETPMTVKGAEMSRRVFGLQWSTDENGAGSKYYKARGKKQRFEIYREKKDVDIKNRKYLLYSGKVGSHFIASFSLLRDAKQVAALINRG